MTPNPVLVGPRDDEAPTATTSGDYLAFARQRPGQNALYDVWVKHGSDPLVKVNKRGQAFTGGIDGHELVYQRTYPTSLVDPVLQPRYPRPPATPAGRE